jgi:hypothetical protein
MALPTAYIGFDFAEQDPLCVLTSQPGGGSCVHSVDGEDTGRGFVEWVEQLLKGCPNLEDIPANRPPSPCPPFNPYAYLKPPDIEAIP